MARYTLVRERAGPGRAWSVFTFIMIIGALSMISTELAAGVILVWFGLWVWWRLMMPRGGDEHG